MFAFFCRMWKVDGYRPCIMFDGCGNLNFFDVPEVVDLTEEDKVVNLTDEDEQEEPEEFVEVL